jgi:hypothetical protein
MAVFSAALLVIGIMGSCQNPEQLSGDETADVQIQGVLESKTGLDNIQMALEDLNGDWVSDYGELFAFEDINFINDAWTGTVTYDVDGFDTIFDGTVEFVLPDDNNFTAGCIYIVYDNNYLDHSAEGNYYALRWEKLTANTIWISGSSDGTGKTSLEDAMDTYYPNSGYFDFGSDCTKTASNVAPTSILGYSDFFEAYADSLGYTPSALPVLP